MRREQFIMGIRKAVYESTINGVVSILQQPPGRRPSMDITALSAWFRKLPPEEKERVRAVIQLATKQAIFGMLAVLDGVRSIADSGQTSALELRSVSQDETIVLNDPNAMPLHDLFIEQVPPP